MTTSEVKEAAILKIRIEPKDRGGVICPRCGKVLLYDKTDGRQIRARCVTLDCVAIPAINPSKRVKQTNLRRRHSYMSTRA